MRRIICTIVALGTMLLGAKSQTATFGYFKYDGHDVRFQKEYDKTRQYL